MFSRRYASSFVGPTSDLTNTPSKMTDVQLNRCGSVRLFQTGSATLISVGTPSMSDALPPGTRKLGSYLLPSCLKEAGLLGSGTRLNIPWNKSVESDKSGRGGNWRFGLVGAEYASSTSSIVRFWLTARARALSIPNVLANKASVAPLDCLSLPVMLLSCFCLGSILMTAWCGGQSDFAVVNLWI